MNDCGCGGGSDCITKNKKEFKKWVKKEMKRLDCGCGCKGKNKFEEKYGELVGGKLKNCPEGWRNDGLTCVKNCESGEKDDGLTCRKPCESGFIDDGLTCRKPITSSMNECPPGSKDIWGTCWGPVRKDCIHDCFKHPAPGCKTTQCGRLEWAGIDWGPKLCTSCNLECGKTCWDVWGITKQLHERELKIYGGEVQPKSIYSKEIRSRIDWEATNNEITDAFKTAFGNDSELAKAFDPEKNGVAEAFRKFGTNSKEAIDAIGRNIKEGFEKSLTPEFKAWLEGEQRGRKRSWERFKQVWGERFAPLNNPEIWIDIAITFAEVAAVIIASGIAVSTFGAGTAASAAMLMAISMIGPSVRMIVKASKGEPIDGLDIAALIIAAIPPPGLNSVASTSFLGKAFQFVQRNKSILETGAGIIIAGVQFGQLMGRIPSTCIANCPTYDDSEFPPKDNPNPIYFPPMDPPPTGQKTDAELLAMAPGNKPFVKFLTDGPEVNPDYIKMTPIKWIKKKRRELYNYPTLIETTPSDEQSKEDKVIDDLTKVEPDKTEETIKPDTTAEEEAQLNGFGKYTGGVFDGEIIEPVEIGNQLVNPGGESISKPPSGKEPPKGPGGCEFNVKCYAQNYPDLYNELKRNDKLMIEYWTDVGKEQGHNPCCGAKLEQGKNYEEDHVKCNARNGFYNKQTKRCDISKNTKGISKNRTQFLEDECKSKGNFWDKGYEIYITEEKTQPDFFTGKYEIRRTENTRPTGNPKCDSERNINGKNKKEEAAKQQAEANKKTIDRIVKEDFFPACYAENNPDVVANVGNTDAVLEKHFREYGINEQRSSKCGATLQEQKLAANKAKALESFNPFCYAYNNPEIFNPIWEAYSEKLKRGERPNQSEVGEALKQHFINSGYDKRLDYSCVPRDSEYNWRCFSENMRTIPGATNVGVNFDNEGNVNRYWESQKNNSFETFNKGSCRDKDISKSQKIRDFNAKCYGFNNPELINKFGKDDAAYLNHYREEGFDQGLDPSCEARNQFFKPECYGLANPDLGTSDVTALTNHWNSNGKNEWRNINCTQEQAETVFQKYYCQDTESFWDGATCDLTRHTNGQLKGEISQRVLDDYINLFPESQRDKQREDAKNRTEIASTEFYNQESIDLCTKKDGYFGFLTEKTRFLSDKWNEEETICDLNRKPNGAYKKDLCAQQNQYYDEVAHICDSSRLPNGLTETQNEIRIAEEIEKNRQEEIEKEKIELSNQQEKLKQEKQIAETLKKEQEITDDKNKFLSENLSAIHLDFLKSRFKSLSSERNPEVIEQAVQECHKQDISSGKANYTNNNFRSNFTQNSRGGLVCGTSSITGDSAFQQLLDDEAKFKETNSYISDAKKKDSCAQQNNYYDEIARICNPSRLPNGNEKSIEVEKSQEELEQERIEQEKFIETPKIETPKQVEIYDNNKIYGVGDLVKKDGITYKMIDGVGLPGYPPPRPSNWQEISTGSGKFSSLTLYWAKWCPHCHDLIPIWKKLAHKGVQIQAIEESESNFKVDGYPTIIFRSGKKMEKYTGPRTKAAIIKFLKNKLS